METNEKIINEPYGFIYITTNMVNGKRYVGQRKFDKRGDWKTYLGSGEALKNAIGRYGKENFVRNIICFCYSKDELNKAEYDISVFLNVVEDRNWYNLCYGGGGTGGHVDTEETKKKKSQASYNMWAQEGFREKMVKIHTGSKHKPFSEEARRHISEGLKGISAREKNPMCREVYSPELDEKFYSAIEAYDKYGVSAQGVSNCCNGNQKTAGKHPITGEPLTWEYVDKTYIDINKSKQGNHKKGAEWWNSRPVNQYALSGELIKRWDCILAAGENCEIDPSSIRKCCAGIYNHAGGFLWRYQDEYDEEFLSFDMPPPKNKGAVVQLDTSNNFIDECYCVAELARIKNFDSSSINKCCNGRMKSYHGYQFIRKDMYELFTKQFGKDLGGLTIYDIINTQHND
jgi:group I intron endonuclease